MKKRVNSGLREYQTEKSIESQLFILKFLSDDEDWHRYGEIKKETKLSDPTLIKQLDSLREIKLIEKNIDTKSGKYPYPVYYRLKPDYVNAFRGNIRFRRTWENMREELEKEKDLMEILIEINKQNNLLLLGILLTIKDNISMNERIKRLLLEMLLWKPYKSLILSLIEKAEPMFSKEELKEFVVKV